MSITIGQLRKKLKEQNVRLVKELDKEAKIIALLLEREAKINATTYPKVRTGRLRSSIMGTFETKDGNPEIILKAGGQSGGKVVNYAAALEFGKGKIKPRFYLGRAMTKVQSDLPTKLQDLLKRVLTDA